jgi:hypothetical protein
MNAMDGLGGGVMSRLFSYWKVDKKAQGHCKQCGFEIIKAPAWLDRIAQKNGFCCLGCEEVYYAVNEMLKREASNG